jgi:predicted enzyme related to lactoylglutathione lyase
MPRSTHFGIHTDNPEAVQPFCQDVFGWTFQIFEGGPIEYWLIRTGFDNEAGVRKVRGPQLFVKRPRMNGRISRMSGLRLSARG